MWAAAHYWKRALEQEFTMTLWGLWCWKGFFDDVTMFLSKFPWRHVELTPHPHLKSFLCVCVCVCVGDNALLTQMPTWAYCTGIFPSLNINACITALVVPWWAKSLPKPLCVSYSPMTLAHLPCQAFEESLQSRLLQAALKTPTAGQNTLQPLK